MIKSTSFGSMQTLLEREGQVVAELMTFENEGRAHQHDLWEICYVTQGEGVIVNGEEHVEVKKGSVCKIPPGTDHWMIPDPFLEILLVYAQSE